MIPPMMIFPRKHFKEHFIKGSPTGSIGCAHPSGWMTAENFLVWLKHFVSHVRPTKEDKVLLLLDNHQSHVCIEVIDYAKEHGVVLLSFPPHCSHKLQPLDRAVYGPFKRYYNSACDCWMRENIGTTMTIYDIPDMVGRAFPRAFTPVNIQSGFKVAGIFPFDRDIFTDVEFLLSDVTDRPAPHDLSEGLAYEHLSSQQQENSNCPSTSEVQCPAGQTFSQQLQVTNSPSTSIGQCTPDLNITPETIRPFHKAAPRKKKRCTRKGKTRILTDTPKKNELMMQAKKKKTSQKTRKRIISEQTESDCEELPALLSDEEKLSHSSILDDDEMAKVAKPSDIKEGEFALVRFSGKRSVLYYVGQVIDVFEDGDVTFRFLKRSCQSTSVSERPTYILPKDTDNASEFTQNLDDIVFKLPAPVNRKGTKRCQQKFVFPVDLSIYNPQ